MQVVAIVLVVVAALAVFAIAAAVIGREARRLDAVAPRAVYDLEEAVAFVADALPAATQARLSHDDVRQLLRMHLTRLRDKGLTPPVAVDQVQDISEPVVLEETTDAAYLIGRAEAAGMGLDDVDVVAVLDAHLDYLAAIGAVGPPAVDPDVPLP